MLLRVLGRQTFGLVHPLLADTTALALTGRTARESTVRFGMSLKLHSASLCHLRDLPCARGVYRAAELGCRSGWRAGGHLHSKHTQAGQAGQYNARLVRRLCALAEPSQGTGQQETAGAPASASEQHDGDAMPSGQPEPLQARVGFVGAGQMGEALIRGFMSAGICLPNRLAASVRSEERQKAISLLGLPNVFGNALEGGAGDLAASCDIIILAVKPQYMEEILQALAPHIRPQHLVISIAAGVTLSTLESALPSEAHVVRVMPNTPCLIGQAASAYAMGSNCTDQDAETTLALLSAVGYALPVEERMMDAVTGLSGSGPAYVFLMIEAMADGGVLAGLPRDKALALATQTVIGSARMIFEGSEGEELLHPAVLRDKVTSPAGTTIAGLAELETAGVRGAIIRAIQAAARRSEELG